MHVALRRRRAPQQVDVTLDLGNNVFHYFKRGEVNISKFSLAISFVVYLFLRRVR